MDEAVSVSSVGTYDSIQSLLSGISITSTNEQLSRSEDSSKSERKVRCASFSTDHPRDPFKRHLSFRLSGKNGDNINETRSLSMSVRKISSKVVSPNEVPILDEPIDVSTSSIFTDLVSNSNNCRPPKLHKNQSSSWQQWIAKKRADRKKKALGLKRLDEQNNEKQRLEQEQNGEKKRIAKAKIRAWIENKNLEARKHKELAGIAQMEQKAEATNRRMQQIKAQEKYREWLEKKREAKIAERQRCEVERRSRELAEREKRQQAEASFQAWLRSNKFNFARRRSPYTYCISDGALIKYFDRMAAPEPGFVNENSWAS